MKRFSGTDEDDSSVSMTSWLFSEKGRMACIPLCVLRSFDTATIHGLGYLLGILHTLYSRAYCPHISHLCPSLLCFSESLLEVYDTFFKLCLLLGAQLSAAEHFIPELRIAAVYIIY